MRVVKIRLVKSNSFWFLNNLQLGPENSVSEPIDLDSVDSTVMAKIKSAEETFGLIRLVPQPEGVKPTFVIEKSKPASYVFPRHRPIKKIIKDKASVASKEILTRQEENKEDVPEVQSVTVESVPDVEELPGQEEPEIQKVEPLEEDFEEAELILKQNGNTVKRIVKNLHRPEEETRRLLLACLEVEKKNKKRKGTVAALEEAYLEVS